MSTLLVLAFATETGAQEMVGHVQALQRQQLISVSDAATVVRKKDGFVKVKQANNMVGAGVFGGAFWGLLIGLLFWAPWQGLAEDAASGVLVDYGVADNFIKEVSDSIKPGYSALFMIVAQMNEDKVFPAFTQQEVALLRTNLSAKDEVKLCAAFGVVEVG